MQVTAGTSLPGSTSSTAQACRDGLRKINAQTRLKLMKNVKGNKGFTGRAPAKGRPKTE